MRYQIPRSLESYNDRGRNGENGRGEGFNEKNTESHLQNAALQTNKKKLLSFRTYELAT